MNFIFDIGNVLIDYKPKPFLRELLNNPKDERKISETIFESIEWVMLDKGEITPDEACKRFCEKEPDYKEIIERVMEKIPEMLTPINETIKLLPKIKSLGHKLYYLSNYHKELSRFIQDKYSFFELFEGGVFSCDLHIVKPNVQIYHNILNKYKLYPKDCVFFDDTIENVEAAKKLGIVGVIFNHVSDVKDFISTIK